MYGIGGIIRCLWGYPYRGLEGSPHRMIPERMEAEIVINRQEVLGSTSVPFLPRTVNNDICWDHTVPPPRHPSRVLP